MKKVISITLVLVVALCAAAIRVQAQEQETSVTSSSSAEQAMVDELSSDNRIKPKSILRLPKYFASIVSDVQRREINDIQRSYLGRTQALQEQLDALKKEELIAIEQVLTEPQRAQLEDMRMSAPQRAKPMARPTTGAASATAEDSKVTSSSPTADEQSTGRMSSKEKARLKAADGAVGTKTVKVD